MSCRGNNDFSSFKQSIVWVGPFVRAHHVDVELVEASERRLGDFPQRQHEADGGEGALAAGQRPHVARAIFLPAWRLHLQHVGMTFI